MRQLFVAILMGGVTTLSLPESAAFAQQNAVATLNKVVKVDIPAQKVSTALLVLSHQAAVQVLMPGKLVDAPVSTAISGQMTLEQAVSRLLNGTNLTFREVGEDAIGIDVKQGDGDLSPIANTPGVAISPARLAQASEQAPGSTSAQDQERGQSLDLQEVIVTAQKRTENLMDVPVPVSVIAADELVVSHELQLQDFYNTIPGLSLTSVGLTNTVSIFIRGLGNGEGATPTVGVVIDDIAYGGTVAGAGGGAFVPDIDPSNLAQIELLRGPQGTLYGASSLGGLLKYTTIAPSLNKLSGLAQVGTSAVENGGQLGYYGSGALNVPVGDNVAVRMSVFTHEDPGYIDNVFTGQSDVNKQVVSGGRLSALWAPSDSLSVTLGAFFQRNNLYGSPYAQQGLGDLQQNFIADTGPTERKIQGYTARVDAKFGSLSFVSLTGFNKSSVKFNSDFTPAFGLLTAANFNGEPGSDLIGRSNMNKFSQEFRLSGEIGHSADWMVGTFYTHEDIVGKSWLYATVPNTGQVVGAWLTGAGDEIPYGYEEIAGFANVTLHLADRFDLGLGARESHNRQTYSETVTGLLAELFDGGTPAIQPQIVSHDRSFTYLVTPAFRVNTDLMIYARLASGYRPGGPNGTATLFNLPPTFKADTTENYELGAKGLFLDRRLSIDASVYHIDWKNIQLQLVDTANDFSYQANAGRAKSDGVELSVTGKAANWITLGGWIAFNNAELTKGFPPTGAEYGNSGDRLPYGSRLSGDIFAKSTFPLTVNVQGEVGADVAYVGDRTGDFLQVSSPQPPRQNYPAYEQVNAYAGVRFDSWTIHFYCNNIADKRGLLGGGAGTQYPAFTYIRPRSVGLSLGHDF